MFYKSIIIYYKLSCNNAFVWWTSVRNLNSVPLILRTIYLFRDSSSPEMECVEFHSNSKKKRWVSIKMSVHMKKVKYTYFLKLSNKQENRSNEKNWKEKNIMKIGTNHKRNWVFFTNSDFLISTALDSNVVDLSLFVRSNNISLKYQRFTTLGSKDIGIRKSEFAATTQFLHF